MSLENGGRFGEHFNCLKEASNKERVSEIQGVIPFASECAAGLYLPAMLFDCSQIELLRDFCRTHAALDILLVRVN